jgi:SpoVK/Ycf46/Vps4 family AAA+-type ATPase
VDTKDSQIMLVMTTNHLDKVPPVLIRPGRIDTFIHFAPPDVRTARKLVEFYAFDVRSGRSLLEPGIDWSRVGEAVAGNIPAVIREIVERSKLGGIRRNPLVLSADDLVIAAAQMRYHAELSAPSKVTEPTPAEKLASSLVAVLKPALKQDPTDVVIPVVASVDAVNGQVRRVRDAIEDLPTTSADDINEIKDTVEGIKDQVQHVYDHTS